MFRRVLVSMDLSPATEALVSALPGMRDMDTEELHLVHVSKPLSEPVSRSLREIEDLRGRLGKLAERLRGYGFSVTVEVPSGDPAVEVVKSADYRDTDIILVGTRSHTRIREAFVGSVAWDIVRRARRPVLLQRIEANRPDPESALESQGSGLPDHVVHPTDFSDAAAGAYPWLAALARKGVAKFTLLHVSGVEGNKNGQETLARLEELADRLRTEGAAEVKAQMRIGSPHEEILAVGGRNPDALVVMGTQGRGFLPEIVMGSVSRQVVRHASSRILLIPAAPA